MLLSRTLNNKIDRLHERALRIIYTDRTLSCNTIPSKRFLRFISILYDTTMLFEPSSNLDGFIFAVNLD